MITSQIIDDDIFDMSFDALQTNQRIAVRYLRKDITAILTQSFLLRKNKNQTVELIDISSKGLLIKSVEKLSKKKEIPLKLIFENQQTFHLKAQVIHQQKGNLYGLKFKAINNILGDYLLTSQNDLSFK